MANNPALLRAVANPAPYLGQAPAHATPPAASSAPSAPAGDEGSDHPLAELHDRIHAIRDQASDLAKNVGYIASDASIHADVPARIETKLGKAQDALAEAMKQIEAVCDDLDETIGAADDGDEGDDGGKV